MQYAEPLIDLRSHAEHERDRLIKRARAAAQTGDLKAATALLADARSFAPVGAEVIIDVLRVSFDAAEEARRPRRRMASAAQA